MISNLIKQEIKSEVDQIIKNGERVPHLAAVLVGNDGASLTYVGSKVRSCEQVGFDSTLVKLPDDISQNDLLLKIEDLNNDDKIDGFIVQLPLPKHIDEDKVLMAVNPNKDVDGFHPTNFGKMALNMETFIPATPYGIIELLKRYNINTSGKNTVVIGRSNIVGRPISILMSRKGNPGDSTVTLVHSRTNNLENFTKTNLEEVEKKFKEQDTFIVENIGNAPDVEQINTAFTDIDSRLVICEGKLEKLNLSKSSSSLPPSSK